jgi:hypothetical protein
MRDPLLLMVMLSLSLVTAPARASDGPVSPTRHPDAPAPESPIAAGAKIVSIPLRDGTVLVGDLYLPPGAERHPALIEVTPYGRRGIYSSAPEHGFWTARGYAYLVVDARGVGESTGTLSFMTDARIDGPQIVEWAAGQAWSTGKVGMRGSSYSGTYPIQTAAQNPRGLACISPNASFHDAFGGSPPYMGGAFMQGWALSWTPLVDRAVAGRAKTLDFDRLMHHRPLLEADVAAHGVAVPVYRQLLAHQTSDAFWRRAQLSDDEFRRIDVPSLAFTGWYDTTLPGSMANFRKMRAISASARDQWLVVGPWDHSGASEGGYTRDDGQPVRTIGRLPVEPGGFKPGQRMAGEFFDWCLKGGPRPSWSAVQVFVPGHNRWIEADGLPLPGVVVRTLFLGNDGPANALQSRGRLLTRPKQAASDHYVYDPADPVRADVERGGRKVLRYGPEDVSAQLRRNDVLQYVTGSLPRPLTMLGTAAVYLHVRTDAPDTDFMAVIEDVAPDGSAIRIGSGWAGVLRARYRNGSTQLAPPLGREATEVRIDLFDNGHTLRRGHRLRLSIMSSAYPFVSINPNTGDDIATDTAAPRVARQEILHGQGQLSRLVFEVLERH